MKIYTKTGDRGTTGIRGGERVSKTDQRIEANGAIDELNSVLGIVRAISCDKMTQEVVAEIQTNLMIIMSRVATRSEKRADNPRILPENAVTKMEAVLDEITSARHVTQDFILPGGNPASAFLHQARSVCRRAERELWRLDEQDPVEFIVMSYVNRLSDLLFAMARRETSLSGGTDIDWERFGSGKGVRSK